MNNWLWMGTSGGVQGWVQGWYKILSVDGSNQATLDASIGAVVLSNYTLNTAIGISTVATPTTGTFSVDYSQQAGVQFSLTGLTTAAANAIILTAAATKAMVGNLIQITGGTNFTAGFYVVQACSAGVSLTVDRNCTTAAGLAGTAGIGGALASPGQAGALMVASNKMFVKYNATAFSISSSTANISGGRVTLTGTSGTATAFTGIIGYDVIRGDRTTNRPTLKATTSMGGAYVITPGINFVVIDNLIIDGNSQTTTNGMNLGSTQTGEVTSCKVLGCVTGYANISGFLYDCEASACTTTGFDTCASPIRCTAQNMTGIGFKNCNAVDSICNACTNSAGGFFWNGSPAWSKNSTAYACTVGFDTQVPITLHNCIAYNNTSFGIKPEGAYGVVSLLNCAVGANGTNYQNAVRLQSLVTLTADPFVNAAGGNFALTPAAIALIGAAAIPGVMPGLPSSIGYLAIGALQPTAIRMLYAGSINE